MKPAPARFPAGLLLVALTLAAFRGVAGNGFIGLDDPGYLTKNPLVARGLTREGFAWALAADAQANWHPLTWLSHMLDVRLFGLRPGPHHLVSLGIHAGSALLLLALLGRLTGALWPAVLAASLFAVHPLRVESVAWAAERKDVLAAFLALAAALAYERAARRGAVLRSAAIPLLFGLALAAKPMPVSLPFLFLLLDWWPLGRFRGVLPPARLWREKLPLFVLAAASAVVTLRVQHAGGALAEIGELSLPVRCANALVSYVRYLGKTLWPADLAPFYPHPETTGPWWGWGGALLLLAALSLGAALAARRRPFVAVGWLWYLGALLPMIGLVQVGAQAMADRYAYLPHIGLFVAASWALAGSDPKRASLRALRVAAPVAALLLCAALTARQVGLWRDDRTLFSHTERVSPGNVVAIGALGDAAERAGDLPTALACYERALALDPSSPNALNNLGNVLAALGRSGEAEDHFRRAILVRPQGPVAHYNLAKILQARGNLEEAERHYRATLRANPLFLPAHTNLGRVLASAGRFGEAAAAFRQALLLDPSSADGRFNLALALARGGDDAAAVPEYRAGLDLAPGDAEALARLGESLARLGRRDEAGDAFRRALALDPGLAIARRGRDALAAP